jgi:DNA modification methylase
MTEIVQIGDATLYHGDCLEILPTLGKVDAVVTDPPYGVGLRNGDVDGHRSARSFAVAGDQDQKSGAELLAWAGAGNLPTVAFASPWKPWPGYWRNLIVWDKGGAVGGGGDIQTCLKRSWELIQVARNGPLQGGRSESVVRFQIDPQATADHICAKPVPLMSWLVSKFTQQHQVILDPFMGSGTTGVACANLGRKFIGIEIERKYFDIACERIDAAYRQGRLFA